MRVTAHFNRFVHVLTKGIVVVPPAARSNGPWLDATRATSLQRVANRPIICHVLDALAAAGASETAVLTVPDLMQDIMDCVKSDGPPSSTVQYLAYDPGADPAQALRATAEFAGESPTILHRADGLLGQPLTPFLELAHQDNADIVLLVARGARNVECLGPAAQQMLHVAELDPAKAALGMAGVCVLGPGVLTNLRHSGRPLQGLELGRIAESLVESDSTRLQVSVVREWHAFAGEALDLLDLNRAVLDTLDDRMSTPQGDGNSFEGNVLIDATASVTSSVICGPVIVGAGAHVSDSYIGPHTSIGARVHMEGVEIERSIVFAGASILHVGGRLVASVVGREARIFRDFSVPRAMRLQVADGDEVALC